MKKSTILVTGAAGFIGSKTVENLIGRGHRVVGVDNMNDYYDIRLKRYRLNRIKKLPRFVFRQLDIESLPSLKRVFGQYRPDAVINLAARAGVRYSLENPFVYLSTNTLGTLNLLELCRHLHVKKLVLASTSSLYAGQPMPFKETLAVNTPISPYAATKKGAEMLCYSYHYLFGVDISIVRYFTVYGPSGRPDMSIFRFIKWIDEGKVMDLFGDGSQSRDFTYIDDIAEGTVRALKPVGFKIMNLGGKRPYSLKQVIRMIEVHLGKKARIKKLPFHKADIMATRADTSEARRTLGWTPKISFEEGMRRTVEWYLANRSWLKKVKL